MSAALILDCFFSRIMKKSLKSVSQLKECADEERGKGYLMSCLVDHRANITERQCHQYITKMTSIVFSDYRLICGFMDKCREDINTLQCGSITVGEKVSLRSNNSCVNALTPCPLKTAKL